MSWNEVNCVRNSLRIQSIYYPILPHFSFFFRAVLKKRFLCRIKLNGVKHKNKCQKALNYTETVREMRWNLNAFLNKFQRNSAYYYAWILSWKFLKKSVHLSISAHSAHLLHNHSVFSPFRRKKYTEIMHWHGTDIWTR